eukprot:755138-Hanusia_phi.AAC.7
MRSSRQLALPSPDPLTRPQDVSHEHGLVVGANKDNLRRHERGSSEGSWRTGRSRYSFFCSSCTSPDWKRVFRRRRREEERLNNEPELARTCHVQGITSKRGSGGGSERGKG